MNKRTQRMLSLALAFMMMLAFAAPVMAAALPPAPPTSTEIRIHKIKMPDLDGWPKTTGDNNVEYTGAPITDIVGYFGADAERLAGVTFTYFEVTDEQLAKMAAAPGSYDTLAEVQAELGATVTGTLTDATSATEGLSITLDHGEKKNYWFIENRGSNLGDGSTLSDAAAVPFGSTLPMVRADGTYFTTGDNALNLYPKNTITKPEIDKNFAVQNGLTDAETLEGIPGGAAYANYLQEKATATATIGQNVPYEVKTKIPAGSTYEKLVWTDVMTNGLTYNVPPGLTIATLPDIGLAETDYILIQDDRGFTLQMKKSGLDKINAVTSPETGAGADVEFTLTYSATVNENAIVDVPDKNNITLDYGNTPGNENVPVPVTPVGNELDVNKTWSEGTVPGGVTVVYTLSNGTDYYPVVLTDTTTGTIDLGNGVTFTVTTPYSGTFSGEALATGTWTIVERVSGYDPAYTTTTDGEVTINNVKDETNPDPLDPTEPEVITGGKKFIKVDGTDNTQVLANARFVVINKNAGDDIDKFLVLKSTVQQTEETNAYNAAETAYKEYLADTNTANIDELDTTLTPQITRRARLEQLLAARDTAYEAMNNQYAWGAEADAIVFTSQADGTFEATGLAYGNYELKEITAPTGYANLTANIPFEVDAASYTNADNLPDHTANDELIIENKKVTIPQTGGIGTVIFGAIGLTLMGGAVVAFKKRESEEE